MTKGQDRFAAATPSGAVNGHALTGPLILVADGSAESRQTLSAALGPLGYCVLTVESGSAALMLLRSERPSLLLLDQGMPGLSGIDLLRELRGSKDSALLPVIIMTQSSDPGLAVAALNSGADDHIVMPCDVRVLGARIERQLERARETSALRHASSALDARLVRRTLEIEELQSRIDALLAEKAALNARLASRDQRTGQSQSVKSIAAI